MSSSKATDSSSSRPSTVDRILDRAQARIQRNGYNAVSYGDLADDLDVTTAAIHYHFPTKGDLGQTLMARYRQASAAHRQRICDETTSLHDRLVRYAALYVEMMHDDRMCLAGILAADASTLPTGVQNEVEHFFQDQEDWLTEVIADAPTSGAGLQGCDTAREIAEVLLATLQGAMFTTPDRDADRYETRIRNLIASIVT